MLISALEIKIVNFIVFFFNYLKNEAALKLQSVRSQEEPFRFMFPTSEIYKAN